jgi:hypothetical protein
LSTPKSPQAIQELLKQGLVSSLSNSFNSYESFTNLESTVFFVPRESPRTEIQENGKSIHF